VLLVFSATLFLSAALLFLVEPMVGKMITPLLGGTPAVWNTCMVFFQALLLAGYAYAHATTSWLGARKQAVVHLLVMLSAFAFFPLAIDRTQLSDTGNPVVAVLVVLALSLGIPFFVISSSAPLFQRWFTGTGHPDANDPYFLYAASNLGSMLALLAYPVFVEPLLPLAWQRWAWCAGYGVLTVLACACAVLVWKSAPLAAEAGGEAVQAPPSSPANKPARKRERRAHTARQVLSGPGTSDGETKTADRPAWPRRLRWIALAAVPSSLLLGATTYITIDIAPIPLLWVLPLAAYILSFIVVFARAPIVPHRLAISCLPPLVLLLLFLLLSNLSPGGIVGVVTIHLVVLFVAALVCHGELATDRPASRFLTELFLWVSVGGVVGGLFNTIVAPLVFNSLAEYELALLVLCALAPSPPGNSDRRVERVVYCLLALSLVFGLPLLATRLRIDELHFDFLLQPQWNLILVVLVFGLAFGYWHFRRAKQWNADLWLDAVIPVAIGGLVITATWGAAARVVYSALQSIASDLGTEIGTLRSVLAIGVPAVFCYTFVCRPARFVLAVNALLVAALFCAAATEPPGLVAQKRGFFGVLRVHGKLMEAPDGKDAILVALTHGTTAHGAQFRDLANEARDRLLRAEPLSYYHRTGPAGQILAAYNTATRPLGVIGLGTGALAAYGLPGQRVDFFEINPLVRDFALPEEGSFTYIADARKRGARVQLFMGDARLVLERDLPAGRQRYGLLVVDAFSSDAIPMHLLTREALQVYLSRLLEDGVLCFHVSNFYLDLKPVLANLAEAEGLAGQFLADFSSEANKSGRTKSEWVVIARKWKHLNRLTAWQALQVDSTVGVWTDDYSNLLRVFRNVSRQRR
jgi:spermidine synthase